MSYQVVFSHDALKALQKLDKFTASVILGWIRKNLEGCTNPRAHGKGLVGNHSRQWRYRVGDYRIIADIQENKVVILILAIGHRRNVY